MITNSVILSKKEVSQASIDLIKFHKSQLAHKLIQDLIRDSLFDEKNLEISIHIDVFEFEDDFEITTNLIAGAGKGSWRLRKYEN